VERRQHLSVGSESPCGSPSRRLQYQFVIGFLLLLAAAAVTGQAGRVVLTPVAWASVLFQGVVISFASYLAWFWLLRRHLATRIAVLFMTSLFAVTFGVLLLGEPVTLSFDGFPRPRNRA
jgi:drug/metabolite transporter (DMT)-like permease